MQTVRQSEISPDEPHGLVGVLLAVDCGGQGSIPSWGVEIFLALVTFSPRFLFHITTFMFLDCIKC